jgi:hypothetical protein
MNEDEEDIIDRQSKIVITDHTTVMMIHVRALAAHCECLGMNAENCFMMQVRPDSAPPYSDVHYFEVMKKWNLIDEKGEPLI